MFHVLHFVCSHFSLSLSLFVYQRLEEVTQELEQKQEENRKLREKCLQLKEKLRASTKTRQELQEVGPLRLSDMSVSQLSPHRVCTSQSAQSERVEQEGRLRALEKIMAQKELLVLATQEQKNRLEMEIGAVREEHSAKLTAALAHTCKQKVFTVTKIREMTVIHAKSPARGFSPQEVEVEQLRTQMTLTQAEELQRVPHTP